MQQAYRSILITGGGGMLAQAMRSALIDRGCYVVALSHADLDLSDSLALSDAIARHKPDLVLNCGAYTKVDLCEENRALADSINGHAVGILAQLAQRHQFQLVHYSTDFVFDGLAQRPYRPDDRPNPLSAYGRSKLLGEQKLQEVNPSSWLLIRTAWLYGRGGPCFPRTMVELARQNKPLTVVNDQIGSPTFTCDLAEATLHLLDAGARGIHHIVNHGSVSWFDFTRAILEEFDEEAQLSPISTADWRQKRPDSAIRPAYSVLDVSTYEQATGQRMRPWRQALRDYRLQVARGGFEIP